MKFRLLLFLILLALVSSSCRFSSDPPRVPENHNYKGLWLGTMDVLPSHKKFDFRIDIITQGQYGGVTGTWEVDFISSKVVGTLEGTTRKDGISFGLKVANSFCELSFRGEEENNEIKGVIRNFQIKECSDIKFTEGVLILKAQ